MEEIERMISAVRRLRSLYKAKREGKMIRLIVDNGAIQALAKETGRDRRTVSLALKGATASPTSREIRALAIAKYNARGVKEVELTQKELLDGMGVE